MLDLLPPLSHVLAHAITHTGYHYALGIEWEWYTDAPLSAVDRDAIQKALLAAGIPCIALTSESGIGQYELVLGHSMDWNATIAAYLDAQQQLTALLAPAPLYTDPVPFPERPGSGLHVHVSIHHPTGENAAAPVNGEESPLLCHAIAGLLEALPASMPFFCPTAEGFARYGRDLFSPLTVSWGGNNRTTALRLPTTTHTPHARRIEHRVPAANADITAVCTTILLGIVGGIQAQALPPPKIWGNAHALYPHIPCIPLSLACAWRAWEGSALQRLARMLH
jgi:gamma-glutamylputrescine synthase